MTFANSALVLGLILLYAGQGFFNKLFSVTHPGKPADVTPMFNVLYGGVVVAGTLIYSRFDIHPDWITWLIGFFNGVSLFLYNYSYINASQSGPYTLQSMMGSFGGIIPPLIFSLTLWGDRLTWLQAAGVALMLAAILLYNLKGLLNGKIQWKGFIWVLMVFLSNGLYCILNDAQQRLEAGAHRNDLITVTFMTAMVISALFLIFSRNDGPKKAFHMPGKALLFALLSSGCAAVAIHLQLYTLGRVPSSLLFPMENGGILIFHTFLSRFVLKEKLDKWQLLGVLAAVGGLVLTNL